MPDLNAPSEIAIIGLGYVGLPLAQYATRAGYAVTGVDRSERVVRSLNGGHSHVDDLSDGDVERMLAAGFRATVDYGVVERADVIVICVPTPLTSAGSPDLESVESAASSIAGKIKRGALVVLESTTFPGTTEDVLAPILASNMMEVGRDFYLAFSPERVDPGNPVFKIDNTPKVVGGVTPACAEAARNFYARFVKEVVVARGAREAETAKLLENTYRHINIALVNELARVCSEMDIDIWDVIRCASTKPFGFQAFYPGPGVGGHCIPIDPNYLSYAVRLKLGHPLRFVELAQEINASMPEYVAKRAQDILNRNQMAVNGSKILLVGVTYKPNIGDERESPAVPLALRLWELGADLAYFDSHVEAWAPGGTPVRRSPTLAEAGFDLAIVLQWHDDVDPDHVMLSAGAVLDTRGVLDRDGAELL